VFTAAFYYVADISLFIGARSDKNRINWFWENGTMITNYSNFPLSNASLCEEMSFPFSYNDGINLLRKRCTQDKAYFACDIPCKSCLTI